MEYDERSALVRSIEDGRQYTREQWKARAVTPMFLVRELQGSGLFCAFASVITSLLFAAAVVLALMYATARLFGGVDLPTSTRHSTLWTSVALALVIAACLVAAFALWACLFLCSAALCTVPLFFTWLRWRMTRVCRGQEVLHLTPEGAVISLGPADCRRAAAAIRENPQLKDFLLGMELKPGSAVAIFDALAAGGGLEVLSCSHVTPGLDGQALQRCLRSNPGIKALWLGCDQSDGDPCTAVDTDGTHAIVEGIAQLHQLAFLELKGRGWASVWPELAQALVSKRCLSFVAIESSSALPREAVGELTSNLALTCPELCSLEVVSPDYGRAGRHPL